jgi:hypothetical protein
MKKFPLISALLLFALGVLLRKVMPKPYVWVFLFPAFGVGLGALAAFVRGNAAKYVCISLMSVFLALFCAESYYILTRDYVGYFLDDADKKNVPISELREADRERHSAGDGGKELGEGANAALGAAEDAAQGPSDLLGYSEYVITGLPGVGYGPRPGGWRVAIKSYDKGRLSCDAVYSTLANGWRVTPQNPSAHTAVVLFGCSFTFGSCLNDDDTYPAKLGALLGPGYQVFNFGFPGYGPHQMLAQIEHGCLTDLRARFSKVIAIFSTIGGHEQRPLWTAWDKFGPRYELRRGKPVFAGYFSDASSESGTEDGLYKPLRNCLVYRNIFRYMQEHREDPMTLYTALVRESDRLTREQCGVPLTVMLWPGAPFRANLEAVGVLCLDMSDLFPPFNSPEYADYTIPLDGHPNARATEIAARALAEYIRAGKQQFSF